MEENKPGLFPIKKMALHFDGWQGVKFQLVIGIVDKYVKLYRCKPDSNEWTQVESETLRATPQEVFDINSIANQKAIDEMMALIAMEKFT